MSKQVNQFINAPVVGDVSGGHVRVSNTTVNNNHQHSHHTTHNHGPVYISSQAPFALHAPSAPPAQRSKPLRGAAQITPAQKELLTLMKPLPTHVRIDVLNWMRCEFGTGLVMELEPRELHQTRQHVLGVRRAGT